MDFLALGASAPHAAAAELLRRAAPPEAVSAQLSDPDPSVRAAAVRLAGWAVTSEDFQRRAALGETEHRDFMCLLEMLVSLRALRLSRRSDGLVLRHVLLRVAN